jgi:CheY-like chemotaxis protein
MSVFHVLVIDDNPADVRLTIQAIAEAGIPCGITIATDADTAMQRLATLDKLPDLILLDLNMPGRSGAQVVTELKSSPRTRNIPVIMLSNSTSEVDIESAYRASANCYIVKPPSFEDYAGVISALSSFWFNVAMLPTQSRKITVQ